MSDIYQRPAELLQNLIRFDTTNPPGNEAECIQYINSLLTGMGVETTVVGKDPKRPNLVARLKGRGEAPGLLMYGHVDVVTTANQDWAHPPFAGVIEDGYVWGRGAVDMKGGVAMALAAFMRAKAEGISLPGDVVFCAVSDEEQGGIYGAKYLVEEHAHLFDGIQYAIGEFGGVPVYMRGKKLYLIQVAEKQKCSVRATVRGPSGHASFRHKGVATAKLGRMLTALDENHLPVHITPAARKMIEAMADALTGDEGAILRELLDPARTEATLEKLDAEARRFFYPLLHNMANPTILQGGNKINVIPPEITVDLDGRLLPGLTPDDLIRELRGIVGDDIDLEVFNHLPGPPEADLVWFDTLAEALREADPEGIPVPFIVSGGTDARWIARLGIHCYGYLPLDVPQDFDIWSVFHAADERVPVSALEFGTEVIYQIMSRTGE